MLYRNPRKGDIIRRVSDPLDVRVCNHDGDFDWFQKDHWEFVTVVPEVRPKDTFVNIYELSDKKGNYMVAQWSHPTRKQADDATTMTHNTRVACLNLVNHIGVFEDE